MSILYSRAEQHKMAEMVVLVWREQVSVFSEAPVQSGSFIRQM